jgi:hypothetical protein
MRIMKAAGNLDAQDCLRHSRLVVTVAENPEEHAPISGGTLDPLLFALETYERRLSLPPGSDALAPETEAKELLSAWNAFEEARLTIELAQETPEKRGTEKVIEDPIGTSSISSSSAFRNRSRTSSRPSLLAMPSA